VPGLDLSNAYPVADLEEARRSLDALAAGEPPVGSPVYARLHNPTVAVFEEGLAELEGAEAAVAFASGMAALTAALLCARAAHPRAGNHVVAVRPLYGGSDHLLGGGLLGLEASFVNTEGVGAAVRPDTALVVLETPANPTLALADIADVVRQAKGAPVLVDSTFATPVLQRPLAHGASLVLHSATKFLGGHGDAVGGVLAGDRAWAARLRQARIATGAVLHPLAAYLLHRGLATLPLRLRAAQEGASYLAERLSSHPAVRRVHYPGRPDGDPRRLLGRQMAGPGALVAFEVAGGQEAAAAVLRRVELLTPAVSLGSTDTLVQHPASLTHRLVDPEARGACGISDGLLRVSVGLEDPRDLWADLAQALEGAGRAEPASSAA
jgi:methionine-gamma-lyase